MFGRTIRKLREKQRLSQRQVADACGISVPYLSDIENVRRPPPRGELLTRLADALDEDPVNMIMLSASARGEFRVPVENVPASARKMMARLERESYAYRFGTLLKEEGWK